MGCLCLTFREEPVTRTWVGWAGPVATFLDGFPRPRPSYLPFEMALGGVLLG
jgi:hypothetical protein